MQFSKDLNTLYIKEALNNIKRYIKTFLENNPNLKEDDIDVIVISPLNISNESNNNILGQIKNISIFYDNKLLNNPTEHKYYNTHIKLDDEEKYNVLKQAGVKLTKTTVIRRDDPIARWFGYKPGDLIKIIREATIVNIGTTSIQYRHCA